MKNRYILAVSISTAILMLTGCGKKPGAADFVDDLNYDSSDLTMAERFENGMLVTDVSFSDIKFPYDSFIIPSSEVPDVEAVINYMASNPQTVVICEGHCDERGTTDYNLSLGENRAQAVRAYMVNAGIDPSRIQTRSMGEDDPLDPGHHPGAWAINRRVEFELYK